MALWQRLTGWLAFLSNGEAGQQDTQRVMEAILPVASLYGVDIGNVETRWFRHDKTCLLYTSPSPRDGLLSRMPSSA